MQTHWSAKDKKIHSRHIEVSTFEYDGDRIIIEGSLKDDRFQDTHTITGETLPRGVIHHMVVRLLVHCSTLVIEDIEAQLISVPRDACRETADCLAKIKGLTITRGFTSKVKTLAGANRGCTHLLELVSAMAPAAVQGYAAHRSQKKTGFDPDQAKFVMRYLVNTCHAWREDGPFVAVLKKMISKK